MLKGGLVSPQNIQERTMEYALRAIRLFRHLNERKDAVAWVIGKQYLRCVTSIGANLAEAQSGESKADFIHKCGVAQKEARESRYWLLLMMRSRLVAEAKLELLMQETEELIAILTSILVSAKRNMKKVPA
jgi:four helix bundle protein